MNSESGQMKDTMESLASYRGQGTSCITILLSPKASARDSLAKMLRTEASESSVVFNRQSVQKALRKIIVFSANLKKVGDTGLAIFADEDSLTVLEPPLPIRKTYTDVTRNIELNLLRNFTKIRPNCIIF